MEVSQRKVQHLPMTSQIEDLDTSDICRLSDTVRCARCGARTVCAVAVVIFLRGGVCHLSAPANVREKIFNGATP